MTNPMTKTDWTSADYREASKRLAMGDILLPVSQVRSMLDFAAKRIEADERAVSVACNHSWMVAGQADHHFTCSKCGEISNGKAANSPAQADERAVPVAIISIVEDATNQYGKNAKLHYVESCMDLPVGDHQLFTHPPAQPAQEQPGWKVPDERKAPMYSDESRQEQYEAAIYDKGWNACRAAMLAASPTPPKEK